MCDASVLVISANAISHKFARVVKEQLERSECPILGVVLNKVDMSQNKYYGKYYGKYGRHYGRYEEGKAPPVNEVSGARIKNDTTAQSQDT